MAIVLVAVSHVWTHRVSGGVDVFLLLSGFFVGGGIVRACLRGDFRVRPFLARTVRRLLPPLAVVVAGVVGAVALLLTTATWAEASRQALSSLLYIQNWYLAAVGQDYGAADIVDSPFQHLWSMSVQGQLFVGIAVVAAVVLGLRRRRGEAGRARTAFIVVAAVTAVSFIYAAVMTIVDQPSAYYDTGARAWEFLLGTLLATAATLRGERSREQGVIARNVWSLVGWTALLLIMLTGVLVDGASVFPGPAALLPLGAAAILVAAPGGSWSPSRLLAWSPLARAGAYAYTLYLWHWPVLILAIAARGGADVGWLSGSAVLVTSAVLAWVTHRLVGNWAQPEELRLTREPERRRRRTTLMVAALAVAVALPAAWLVRVDIGRAQLGEAAQDLATYPGVAAVAYPELFAWNPADGYVPDLALAVEDKPRVVFDGCNSIVSEVVLCEYGDLSADKTIAVAGGSHTEQWTDALAELGTQRGFRVVTAIKWACELVDGDEGVEYFDDDCVTWGGNAVDELERMRPDAVFTTWTRPTDNPSSKETVPPAYEAAWDRLAATGIPVVLVRDNPWVGNGPLDCLADTSRSDETCGVLRSEVLDDDPPLTRQVDASPFLRPLDLIDLVCPDGWCPAVQGGRIVYRDDHHLTNSWVLSTMPVLEERFLPLIDVD